MTPPVRPIRDSLWCIPCRRAVYPIPGRAGWRLTPLHCPRCGSFVGAEPAPWRVEVWLAAITALTGLLALTLTLAALVG